MKKIHYKKELRNWRNSSDQKLKSVGFVPTMGALHSGHLSLIHHANNVCDLTISSIFVNPKQFDKKEDLVKYPRTEEQDCALLEKAGCNITYLPTSEDLYDEHYKDVSLKLGILAKIYEGEKRVGHFEGVVQVLFQLFDAINPTDVFFGQKDYQQCMVVNKLIQQYFPGITLHKVPTVRDGYGLALSSRNKRLSNEGIEIARKFNIGLKKAATLFDAQSPAKALLMAKSFLENEGLIVEYLDFANASDLDPLENWKKSPPEIVVVSAVWLEGIRLIDNLVFQHSPKI